ncbi:MAG: type II toxin-antitoxin system VapC family toxin [Elusimicrobia bacterium]|nr:type II toxin-antitoxin system VapC family toxin [Elusimicrobiota bacterium]
MKRVFVDTSAWYAYVWPKDRNHAQSREALERWDGRLVTSNFVFDELISLSRKHLGHSIAVRMGEELRNQATVDLVRLLPEDEEDAWAFFKLHKDKGYSFTDCTSFALMRRLRLPMAITTDKHFRQAGFEVEPGPA